MIYLYCVFISLGTQLISLLAIAVIVRRKIRPLIAPLKGVRIAFPPPPIISGNLPDKPL